jgi:hypothetical protein
MHIKTILLLFILLYSVSGFAQIRRNVAFLGNSYTDVNNLPQIASDVASSTGDTLVFSKYTPGGYTLEQHLADTNSLNLVKQPGLHYIILQEQSQLPAFQGYYSNGPGGFKYLTQLYNPCARDMYFMTWGRKNGDPSNCAAWPPICTYSGMDSLLRLRYIQTATDYRSEISPVGAVWRFIRQNYPLIELYQSDESHPSFAGSYAAACCFYSAIFKKDPTLIGYDYVLNAGDAAAIRNAAKVVVFDSLLFWDKTIQNPVANFFYIVGNNPNEIQLINGSTDADFFLWDFGDGTTSTDRSPVHSYSSNGTFNITLTAIDCDFINSDTTYQQISISFCNHTPVIFPDSIILCPGTSDTLWTQPFDSYQWADAWGVPLANETNQYLVVNTPQSYSVLATLNGCTEMSQQAFVEIYAGLVFYSLDSSYAAPSDTACNGDTLLLTLWANKPPPVYHEIQWYKDGILIGTNDSIAITATGRYSVAVENAECRGNYFYSSDTVTYNFKNCNIGIDENYLNNLIKVYPNPANGFIEFSVDESLVGNEFSITDIFGKTVYKNRFHSQKFKVDINVSSGIYIVTVEGVRTAWKFFVN